MLALLGFLTIVVMLAAIMTKKLSPMVALIAIPIVAGLIGGFGFGLNKFIINGVKNMAPIIGMFIFAITYFGIVTDAGMLDPIINRILRTVGTKPARITVGTTLLALIIHLDGSGAVCFLITIPAMIQFTVLESPQALQVPAQLWWIAVALATVCTVLPVFLVAEALKRIGANHFALIGALGPVTTVFADFALLEGALTMAQVLGGALVISGVLLVTLKRN